MVHVDFNEIPNTQELDRCLDNIVKDTKTEMEVVAIVPYPFEKKVKYRVYFQKIIR